MIDSDATPEDGDYVGTEWGPRPGIVVYRCLLRVIKHYVTQPWQVDEFRRLNGGMVAQFPVDMRRNLELELDRIGAEDGGPE